MTHDNRLAAFVHTLRFEAQGILGVELRPQGDQVFPPFSAGAHIDLHLPNGLVRSYSLLNSPEDCGRYVLGILRDRGSRGGSAFVHDSLRVGMQLQISRPRNLFPLEENAAHSVLVAGGIGVTPIYCMFNRLRALGRSVELLYCARSRQEAAFVEELAASDAAIQLHFDDEKGGPMDLGAFLGARASTAHFYCCGPTPMIDAFETHCERLGHPHVHIERFAAAPQAPAAPQGSYEVRLARSGTSIEVPSGKSLLDALLEAGVAVDCSCREGVCGSCETRVLEGEPEHRDGVLTKAEKIANQTTIVCASV
ncbi:PDR/VanB family oxidoreductase, partial [Pseudomonas aeruginosa]|uniref:PDR/VanB family oxidoreductase n=1 Tax=Pseudomonas aeruginosa TaxID=287 RepID=UPI0039680654